MASPIRVWPEGRGLAGETEQTLVEKSDQNLVHFCYILNKPSSVTCHYKFLWLSPWVYFQRESAFPPKLCRKS